MAFKHIMGGFPEALTLYFNISVCSTFLATYGFCKSYFHKVALDHS